MHCNMLNNKILYTADFCNIFFTSVIDEKNEWNIDQSSLICRLLKAFHYTFTKFRTQLYNLCPTLSNQLWYLSDK
jgi:hypothetical protein